MDSLLGHFSFAEFSTITVKLGTTIGNSSPRQTDVILCDVFLALRITL